MEKVVSVVAVLQKPFSEQINEWFLYNGNTGMKRQCRCMFKVRINL